MLSADDRRARELAGEWHADAGALHALTATGEIQRTDALLEIGQHIASTQREMRESRAFGHAPPPYLGEDLAELRWLSRYVRHQGDRPPA